MAISLFGFELGRKKKEEVVSPVPPDTSDGSTIVGSPVGGYYGYALDLDGQIKNENELIRRYRETAAYSDCDTAIDDIVCEVIVGDTDEPQVKIQLDDLKVSDGIKKKISDEFDEILNLLKFEDRAYDIFRTWYIDGRLYYHIMIDQKNTRLGIQELRYIDPRKIRKIKAIQKQKSATGVDMTKKVDEYYLYNEQGVTEKTTQGIKLSTDSVVFVPSGLMDQNTGTTLSYLHKAIKPVNQLKMMEDATVIYTISRAPERRIFYIDVGNLPKLKAEQYVNDIMNKYRNKITYDASTGEVKDTKKYLSMLEDFWMPRREGGKGTEITTLQGGSSLGTIDNVNYFQQKVYQALNVPVGRLQPSDGFNLGRSSEITREELKFSKFVARLRRKFTHLFNDLLKVQLVLKGIINVEDWDEIKQFVKYDFLRDNYFTELKELEILAQRAQILQQIDPYVGKYYSMAWVKKHVLRQTDEDIKEEVKEMEQEVAEHPEYFPFLQDYQQAAMNLQIQQQNMLADPEQEGK